jgi:hypothetical protein
MLYAESNYKSVPDILAAFAPEFKTEHFHIHGGKHHNSKEDALLSVIKDDTNQLHQGARLALKGAAIGLVSALFYNAQYGGKENEFIHTRSILNKAYHHFIIQGKSQITHPTHSLRRFGWPFMVDHQRLVFEFPRQGIIVPKIHFGTFFPGRFDACHFVSSCGNWIRIYCRRCFR